MVCARIEAVAVRNDVVDSALWVGDTATSTARLMS